MFAVDDLTVVTTGLDSELSGAINADGNAFATHKHDGGRMSVCVNIQGNDPSPLKQYRTDAESPRAEGNTTAKEGAARVLSGLKQGGMRRTMRMWRPNSPVTPENLQQAQLKESDIKISAMNVLESSPSSPHELVLVSNETARAPLGGPVSLPGAQGITLESDAHNLQSHSQSVYKTVTGEQGKSKHVNKMSVDKGVRHTT